MRARIEALESDKICALLLRVLARLLGLIFDILAENPERPNSPPENLPWCFCSNCREMNKDLKRLCCRRTPETYISNMAHMQ